jgi:hypothetical protein
MRGSTAEACCGALRHRSQRRLQRRAGRHGFADRCSGIRVCRGCSRSRGRTVPESHLRSRPSASGQQPSGSIQSESRNSAEIQKPSPEIQRLVPIVTRGTLRHKVNRVRRNHAKTPRARRIPKGKMRSWNLVKEAFSGCPGYSPITRYNACNIK